VQGEAAVAWRKPNGDVGLRFEQLPQNAQEELQLWLEGRYFEN